MIPHEIALISQTEKVPPEELALVAAALSGQAQRDLGPAWGISANVNAFPSFESAPLGSWKIYLKDDIGEPGALGVHMDEDNQPYSLVDADAGQWSITASHEMLEMLVDPWGLRFRAALPPADWTGGEPGQRVRFLLEVADPPEAVSYETGGVLVSDFILPSYYYSVHREGALYSFTGSITGPRQVLDGGYISWQDSITREWWQRFVYDGQTEDRNLGRFDSARHSSLRAWIDESVREARAS